MNYIVKTTTNVDETANLVALSIITQLKLDKHVLFFVTGGSSIPLAVKISEILRNKNQKNLIKNLTITLTDERYGEVGHVDSNWSKLIQKGFDVPGAKLIPILDGGSHSVTTDNFKNILNQEFEKAEYKIGLFGIGADGHTAGILPESVAIHSKDLACGYDTPSFSRITMTFKAIEKMDEIIVWAQGKEKWNMLKSLENNINIEKQPAQILKRVPSLTIFTDYKVE